jgi:tryptophan synthase alpha chain
VGFGIAGPEQASEVAAFADGVIVGSALINLVSEAGRQDLLPRARDFTDSLRRALERPAA